MASVVARIKAKGKQYEIQVDLDEALKFKAGKGDIMSALQSDRIFTDVKKGNSAPNAELMSAFGTSDVYEIAEKIIKDGEVQKTQDFRDAEKEARIKQVITLVVKNAVDQNGRPYTEERIKRAADEVHFNFDNRPAEQQMTDLIHKIKEVIPIKIEVKKIKIIVPAVYTGQVYGLIKDFKESEEWLANGSMEAVLNIPSGLQLDFYDKLNHITHGAVQSQELKSE